MYLLLKLSKEWNGTILIIKVKNTKNKGSAFKLMSLEIKDKPVENKAAASPMIPHNKKGDLSGSEWDKNIMNTEGNPDVAESSLNIREDDLIAK